MLQVTESEVLGGDPGPLLHLSHLLLSAAPSGLAQELRAQIKDTIEEASWGEGEGGGALWAEKGPGCRGEVRRQITVASTGWSLLCG